MAYIASLATIPTAPWLALHLGGVVFAVFALAITNWAIAQFVPYHINSVMRHPQRIGNHATTQPAA